MESHLCVWHHGKVRFLRLDSILQQAADSMQANGLDYIRLAAIYIKHENAPERKFRVLFLLILIK